MKGSRGKRSKAATHKDKVGTVDKPQVEEPKCRSPRLRSKAKVDYNENVLALKGDVEKKSNQHGGKRKNVTKKNETSEERRVESSKNHLDVKSSKAPRRLVLKRKTDVDHDAQSLVGSDHAEGQQQKRQKRSYPDELKREIAEKVAEKGNMREVARIYSAKLGFPVNESTIRSIKAQVEQWDAAEKERKIQEDGEDKVADDDERSNEDEISFLQHHLEKDQDESDEEDTAEGEDNSEAETDEEEGTNEEEGLLEDETDGEASRFRVAKAMKGKEGEDEPEVEVTFDTTAFVETPLTEGCKKIRQLEMEMKKVEKNEELLKMKKAAYARELLREQEKQLMLLKKTLAKE